MKSRLYLFLLFMFSLLLFAAAEAETMDSLQLESFGNELDPRWRIEYVAEGDQSFKGPLNQYKFHQEQGLNIMENLNQSLKDAFGESFFMHAGVDEGTPTWLYSCRCVFHSLNISFPLSKRAVRAFRLQDGTLMIHYMFKAHWKRCINGTIEQPWEICKQKKNI